MEKIIKTPDKKMHIGAMMAIIVSIIMAIWAVIMVIMVFAVTSLFQKHMPETGSNVVNDVVNIAKTVYVISALITVVLAGIIIWLCRNVLKGKAKNGLTAGITTLVLYALSLISFFSFISGIGVVTLFISFAGIAAGILLIIGKYETSSHKEIVVETISENKINN